METDRDATLSRSKCPVKSRARFRCRIFCRVSKKFS